jgi:hypothetical protein
MHACSSVRFFDNDLRRYCQKIGVVYVSEGQRNEQDVWLNTAGSADYQLFLSGLGWGVWNSSSMTKHVFF